MIKSVCLAVSSISTHELSLNSKIYSGLGSMEVTGPQPETSCPAHLPTTVMDTVCMVPKHVQYKDVEVCLLLTFSIYHPADIVGAWSSEEGGKLRHAIEELARAREKQHVYLRVLGFRVKSTGFNPDIKAAQQLVRSLLRSLRIS